MKKQVAGEHYGIKSFVCVKIKTVQFIAYLYIHM